MLLAEMAGKYDAADYLLTKVCVARVKEREREETRQQNRERERELQR